MKSYRELEVYKESKALAVAVHKMTLTLPQFEQREEGSQVRRSSKAVTSMIVEGYGRNRHKADFIKYLIYAHAECDETMVHLDFLFATGSLTTELVYRDLTERYSTLSKKISAFINWVDAHWNDFPDAGTNQPAT